MSAPRQERKVEMYILKYMTGLRRDLEQRYSCECMDRTHGRTFTGIYFARSTRVASPAYQLKPLSLQTTIDTELPGGTPGCGDPVPPGIPIVHSVVKPPRLEDLIWRENPSWENIEMMQNVIHN